MKRARPLSRYRIVRCSLAVLAGVLTAGSASAALAQSDPPTDSLAVGGPIVELHATGVVDPFLASYLTGAIERANADHVGAIVIIIDTPGGWISSTREITQAILGSDVPVITFVAPAGARAASAGTFLLMAGSVAAMAPGTEVGAAHPVGLSGVVEEEKATNDAAAALVSIAQARGRNEEFAQAAVADSRSITAEDAVADDVVDLIEPDVATLLNHVDGLVVTTTDGTSVTLATAGLTPVMENMNPVFAALHSLLTPDLAFIFFWLGLGLIILEIFTPSGALGTLGALSLVSSIASFGMLPVQLIGIVLLAASVVFFLLELKHPGIGLPAIGGVTCLVLGGISLYDPSIPGAAVSPWVIALVAGLMTFFFGYVVQAAIRLRHVPAWRSGELVGAEGLVVRSLDPSGTIRVESEEWSATSDQPATVGERVRVVEVHGLRLRVEPVSGDTASRDTARNDNNDSLDEGDVTTEGSP